VYPDRPWAESSFPFSKAAGGDGFTGGGDWSCTGEAFSALESAVSPDGFALLGCYPNPFNPETTIRFNLPQAAPVTLRVFDLRGSQVAELVNGWRAEGQHEVTFNGAALPSGVYFYKLQAGGQVFSEKMLLLK
jgi:hypothetical protein